MKAYVQIHADPGNNLETITETIRRAPGVKEVCRVVGNCDILVTVEGNSLKHLSDLALQGISTVRGVSIAQTLICIDSEILPKPIVTVPSNTPEQIPAISFS